MVGHAAGCVRRLRGVLAALVVAGGCAWAVQLAAVPGAVVHASTHADRAAGEALFHEKGCEHCHGPALLGGERGPALVGVGRKLTAGGISRQIVAGGGGMPAFGDVLAPGEITRLADYLAAQKKRVKPVQPAPGVPAPKPAANGSDDQT